MDNFYQHPPLLKNQYTEDLHLQNILKHWMPQEIFAEVEKDLKIFGERVVTDILTLGREAERRPPEHVPYDPWGRRIDEIRVAHEWEHLKNISAREGLVAIGYERKQGAWARLYQFTKLYLFHPSSAFYSCPLAMTDGAARVLEVLDPENAYLSHLCSRDPNEFWTSGQWMTEKTGGSDVSYTATEAQPSNKENGIYYLSGIKWFSSATTSEMALTLGRTPEAGEGSRGLSLFYLTTRNESGQLNGIYINRLKDKLGTKALPTAELTLHQCRARQLGETGQGVKNIAHMLNVTRIHNAVCSVAQMRRGLALATDYASKRKAFGRTLKEHPLHQRTLLKLQSQFLSSLYLTFHLTFLMGKVETNQMSYREQDLLRLLIPVTKLYTGKLAVSFCSEIVECFGGAGYIEDTEIPVLLRDAQVFPIWEGTTNVLSLDTLRVLKNKTPLEALDNDIHTRLSFIAKGHSQWADQLTAEFSELRNFINSTDEETLQAQAREVAWSLARLYGITLMAELATSGQDSTKELKQAVEMQLSSALWSQNG